MKTQTVASLSAMVLFVLLFSGLLLAPEARAAATPAQQGVSGTVAGVALKFTSSGVIFADARQALTIGFADANSVTPRGAASHAGGGAGNVFERAAYSDLWPGVDLVYEREEGGFVKSTLYADAGADLSRIGLTYNAPVSVADDGSLVVALPGGAVRESAPVAWQEKGGERMPVEAAFAIGNEGRVGFRVGSHDPSLPLVIDPSLAWNTFTPGSKGLSCVADPSGNIYATGLQDGLNTYIAKFDTNGALLWGHTFGNNNHCAGNFIALDSDQNVYVTGYSKTTWDGPGSKAPLHAYTGGYDLMMIKLDKDGVYQWHTFWGTAGDDHGKGLVMDSAANAYVAGDSAAAWGTGNATFPGNPSLTIAKFDKNGALHWNIFPAKLTATSIDGIGIAMDGSGNLFITSTSENWTGPSGQPPLHAFNNGEDIFVLKTDSAGDYKWHTFYGHYGLDQGQSIAMDSSGSAYVTGFSADTWNGPGGKAPVTAYAGGLTDIFVLKLDNAGAYKWHTFAGSTGIDKGYGVAVDSDKNSYVTGLSYATWGDPVTPFTGGQEIVLARFDSAGKLNWNAFFGSTYTDDGYGVALDPSGNLAVAGYSDGSWGTPVATGEKFVVLKFKNGPASASGGTLSVTVDPADKATDVARDKVVKLTFSAAMKTATVKSGLAISPVAASDYSLSWSSDNKTLSVTVKSKWAASTKYTISLPKTVNSTANAQLSAALSSSFTTKAQTASEISANAGGAPDLPQITATLNQGGITTGQAAQMEASDGVVLIPDAIGLDGAKGCALGTGEDQAQACDEAESFAALVPNGNMAAGFNAADTVASVKNLEANASSSTAAAPKIVTLYAQGYLPGGADYFPQCFKARTDTYEVLEFSYVDEMTAAKIKAAADGDAIAGFSLLDPTTGKVIQPQESLPALAGGYTLVLYIKDNGKFDTNAAWGRVKDPSYITSSPTGTGSGSSGCMLNPSAGLGFEWLLLLIAPMVGLLRGRLRKQGED